MRTNVWHRLHGFTRIFVLGVLVLVVVLFFTRLILPSQVDDVNPLMGCSFAPNGHDPAGPDVLELADVYFVVPKFDGVAIEREWCERMKKRASSAGSGLGVGDWEDRLAMHGVYHTYREFEVARDEAYFDEGVGIFRECFGFEPERFKAGNLAWTGENDWIKDEVEVDLFWNQVFHKVYHCGDSGVFPNWFVGVY